MFGVNDNDNSATINATIYDIEEVACKDITQ